ncbi:integrase catalytic domain-containing protein [Trichonephila inaurata madagascariensis]|uniref:Integrase catalytic domain-containing protein n=1 Tax=Trichonephila inaurata madagascariensis TaxID=2747483 RepID=A0A8X6X2P0_9ARAC|nr:integrase catalytic domain-containing protein [Trichonephila inaurata madagascariensis]
MYVDNCVASVDSSEELESFQRDSTELLALGKFDLRGWRHSDIESNFDFQDNQQKFRPTRNTSSWTYVECESLINSRPLTYVTDDVEDLEPLTPAMFLQDIREVGVPELDQIDENKLNKRLVYRNRIQKDLRKRF